jgi:hypothetical protein
MSAPAIDIEFHAWIFMKKPLDDLRQYPGRKGLGGANPELSN